MIRDLNITILNKKVCILLVSCLALLFGFSTSAQTPIQTNDSFYRDSIKKTPYPYSLPFLAKKIQKRGIELPLPYGLMMNYIRQTGKLKMSDLAIAVGDRDFVPLDFVTFDNIENVTNTENIKFDAWVLPFLNVYGLYARSQTDSKIPMTFPFNFDIKVSPDVNTYGLGTVFAYRFNSYFTVLNYNWTWSDVSTIDRTLKGTVFSARVGRVFDLPRKYHNISVSIGAQHQYVDRYTEGSLKVSQLFAGLDPDNLQNVKNEIADAANNWYDDLSKPQQVVVNKLVNEIDNWLTGKTPGDIPIAYRFNKENLAPWSLQLGVQYNYGKRWWYRVETGISDSRSQLLLSANYRFGF